MDHKTEVEEIICFSFIQQIVIGSTVCQALL